MDPRSRSSHVPVSCLAVLLGLLTGPPGRAALTDVGIEVDGDYEDDAAAPGEDWHPDFPPSTDPIGSADDTLCGTSPAPKNDIYHYFLANDHDYLWVAMERLTNNGNTSFFFRFDVTGDGPSVGDFIFVFCFGSGSVVTETYVLEWDESLSDWAVDATPPEVLFAVNELRVTAPFGTVDERGRPTSVIDPGRFAEARITLADIEGFDLCEAGAVTGVIETKASCSLSSECKDTTGPFTFSFQPLTVDLSVMQQPSCEPVLVATAHARSTDPIAYRWFLDGEEITGDDPAHATSDTIVIPLDDECGPVVVAVIADDGTCAREDAATVDVDRRPQAAITSLSTGPCDLVLAYDGSTSDDCGGQPLTHAWDFDGDGVVDSTAASGTHAFTSCGDRVVTLIVSDGTCTSEPVSQAIHVNEPPVAVLGISPDECLAVTWTSLSTDCDLETPSPSHPESLQATIDFGDGSPLEAGTAGLHEYAECGTYLLTLTVTDASGCVASDTREVTFTGVLTVD